MCEADKRQGLFVLCTYRHHGSRPYDLLNRRSAGQVADRLGETLQQRSESDSLGKTLDKLHPDVASIEIREDEDVGPASYRAVSLYLFGCNLRYNRRIQLQLAVYKQVRPVLMDHLKGLQNYVDALMARAALR